MESRTAARADVLDASTLKRSRSEVAFEPRKIASRNSIVVERSSIDYEQLEYIRFICASISLIAASAFIGIEIAVSGAW